MTLGAPQILVLVMVSMGVGIHLAKDGQPKEEKYSFIGALFADGLLLSLLWWGGFFGG